jgi:hypothetical protein
MTLIFDEIFFLATDTFVLAKGMINFALGEREKEDDRLYMFLMTGWAFGSTMTLVNINSLMYAMYAIKTLCTQIQELECTSLSSIDCSIRAFTWPFTIE